MVGWYGGRVVSGVVGWGLNGMADWAMEWGGMAAHSCTEQRQ